MEDYCVGNETVWEDDVSLLHPTALAFMKSLGLSSVHPGCHHHPQPFSSVLSSMNVIPYPEEEEGQFKVIGNMITFGWQAFPALLAMAELWLRLFAFVIAPLSIAYLLSSVTPPMLQQQPRDYSSPTTKKTVSIGSGSGSTFRNDDNRRIVWVIVLGLASSMVLFTDSLYVLAYGRSYGAGLYGLCLALGLYHHHHHQQHTHNTNNNQAPHSKKRRLLWILWGSVALTGYLLVHSESAATTGVDDAHDNVLYGHPGIDIPTIEEGTYVSHSNALMKRVASLWPEETRQYSDQATPYLPTGDAKTGIPFLVNPMPMDLTFHRVWVPIPHKEDDAPEAVALEIAFPPTHMHHTDKTVYLILHGLNGGTQEAYVRDFVQRRTNEGHTCIIMIARGLMDTPILGWNVFKGSRITDVDAAARAIRKAIGKKQPLAGVGYSMGAIILSNYVARSGKRCPLDMAMAVSGGLDMREQLNFQRSKRLWQPMLAKELRDKFIIGKLDPLYRHRLTAQQYLHLMRASSIHEIDKNAVVTYNGYDDLLHYYTEMSAMGDTTQFQKKKKQSTNNHNNNNIDNDKVGRIANVAIPFCVFHALDDPLVTWRTMGHDPQSLVNTGSGFIMMVLTKGGGHVGWPLGYMPHIQSWKFMNDAVRDFVESVRIAKTTTKKRL